MTFAECIDFIRQRANAGSPLEAIQIARASLTVLADCLPGTLTEELVAALPSALAGDLRRPDWKAGERWTLGEIVQGVARYEGVTEAAARRHFGVVLEVLQRALRESVLLQLFAELPEEARELVGADSTVPRMHQAVA